MNVRVDESGRVAIDPPLSTAGERLELRAGQGLIVGLTACSAEMSNNGRCKPINYCVMPATG